MKRGVMISLSPTSSSSLPIFVADSLRPYAELSHYSPKEGRARRYFTMARTFHPSRKIWRDRFEAESEHRVAVWRRSSRLIQSAPEIQGADFLVQLGLHFNGFPKGYRGGKYIFLHGTLSMLLNSHYECDMWLPPKPERAAWIDLEKEVLRAADAIFIGSKFLREVLTGFYGIPDSKIVYAGTGTPPLGFQEVLSARPWGGGRLLFVGKDFERKGGRILLQAFEQVRRRFPDATLTIVGPKDLGVAAPDGVTLVGRVSDRAEMGRLFAAADVFVLPTLHDSFGFVYLEAMHFGLPCVGTTIFAVPEIISHEATGLLSEPGDAGSLAAALKRLLADPALAQWYGAAGAAKVKRDFVWADVGSRMAAACGLTNESEGTLTSQ